MRRVAAAALVLSAVIALGVTAPAGAAPADATQVAIASFNFAPPSVEIDQGGAVEWTNLDAVVHTVTAERGEFASGHMRQGQRYSLTFTAPGRYQYFCETHDDMRAEVVVVPSGSASAPVASTTTSTQPPVAESQHPAAVTTTSSTVASPVETQEPDPDAGLSTPGAPLPAAAAVVSGGVTGGTPGLSAPLVVAAVVLLALALGVVMGGNGVRPADAAAWSAAALTLLAGGLHLQLRFAVDYPEPIGMLMVIAAAAAALVAAYIVTMPWDWTVLAAGVGLHAASLVAFVLSRSGTLFGYHEVGWDPSPQSAAAIGAEAGALVLLVVAAGLHRRARQTAPAARVS